MSGGGQHVEKAVVFTDSELVVLLKHLSHYLAETKFDKEDLKEAWEEKNLNSGFNKMESLYHEKSVEGLKPFSREYHGFESVGDLINGEDITWWMQQSEKLDGEFGGTLRVRIDYVPEE